MAKRSGAANLVGLAALGALGYKMLQDKKGSSAPVEDRVGKSVEPTSDSSGEFSPTDFGTTGFVGRDTAGDASAAEMAQNLKPSAAPKATTPKAAAPKAAAPKATTPKATAPTTDLRDREAGMSRGTRPDYREPPNVDIEAGMSRGTRSVRDTGDQGDRLLARYPAPKPEPKFFSDRGVMVYGGPYGPGMKKGGAVKKMASGGVTRSSASKRADGIAQKGKTRGKMY